MFATRRLVIIATMLALLITSMVPGVATAAQVEPGSGVTGTSYTSPQFGYSLSWDATWNAVDAATETGRDSLYIDNGVMALYVDGYATGDDLATCVQVSVDGLSSSAAVSNFVAAEGQAGVLAGGDETQQWAVYDFTFTSDGTASENSVIIQCFTVEAGISQVVFSGYMPKAEYNSQIGLYQAITGTLTIPAGAPVAAPTPSEADPAVADPGVASTGVTANTFNSEQFGVSFTWDETWTPGEEVASDGHDGLELNNGVSLVYIDAYATDQSLQQCLDNEVATIQSNTNISNFVQAVTQDQQPLGAVDETQAWGVYDFNLAAESGAQAYSAYVKCVDIKPGESQLVIVQYVPSDAYNDQIETRRVLLDSIAFQTADPGVAVVTTNPGITGTSYASPTYGYTISWDDTWTAEEESSEGRDTLILDNGISTLYLDGVLTSDDLAACLDTQLAVLQSTPGVTNVVAATAGGQPMGAIEPDFSFSVYDFEYTTDTGTTVPLTQFVECRTIEAGVSQAIFTQTVASDAYNDQITARSTVIDSFALAPAATTTTEPGTTGSIRLPRGANGTAGGNATTGNATTGNATNGASGLVGNSYTSPAHGFGLNWDATWESSVGDLDGNEALLLSNGVSRLLIVGMPSSGTLQQCLDGLAQTFLFSDPEVASAQLATSGGQPMTAVQGTLGYAVYDFLQTQDDGSQTAETMFAECAEIQPGVSQLAIVQFVSSDAYNDQIPLRKAVLDTIQLP